MRQEQQHAGRSTRTAVGPLATICSESTLLIVSDVLSTAPGCSVDVGHSPFTTAGWRAPRGGAWCGAAVRGGHMDGALRKHSEDPPAAYTSAPPCTIPE